MSIIRFPLNNTTNGVTIVTISIRFYDFLFRLFCHLLVLSEEILCSYFLLSILIFSSDYIIIYDYIIICIIIWFYLLLYNHHEITSLSMCILCSQVSSPVFMSSFVKDIYASPFLTLYLCVRTHCQFIKYTRRTVNLFNLLMIVRS